MAKKRKIKRLKRDDLTRLVIILNANRTGLDNSQTSILVEELLTAHIERVTADGGFGYNYETLLALFTAHPEWFDCCTAAALTNAHVDRVELDGGTGYNTGRIIVFFNEIINF